MRAIWLAGILASSLHAAFIAPYAPGNFTLTNIQADGIMDFRPNGSLVITGGNDGSILPGSTRVLATAAGSGLVTFNFSYSVLDDAFFEVAGYMLGNTRFEFADRNGVADVVSFSVNAGQTFGFYVDTVDNLGEPGYLTITNFEAPLGSGGAPVPEPSTWLSAGLALLCVAAHRKFWKENKS
ncbi:MAG: PEP-CTERM sorting domain-containing protein [Bryobacteraceae bacterium]|nr:PEP-CTERM sorting domain-containing protein [Bryobacteraceae bacterium]